MIKFLLFFFLFVLICIYYRIIIFAICHLHLFIQYGFLDLFHYFKFKEYNLCHEYGIIRLNSAKSRQVFGNGKTLTLVRQARSIYKKYNGKVVYDPISKEYVTQRINIISNVELHGIPYIKWKDTSQFIDLPKMGFGPMDITIFLLDESGAIFNSRDFRTNITSDFLTRLLQSRKNKMALYMTSQRFQFTDKILRQTCSTVTTCEKHWRVVEVCDFDAFEVENASSPALVKPLRRSFYFATDDDYNSYNSYQVVENLDRDVNSYVSDQEVLQFYDLKSDFSAVPEGRRSRYFSRSKKKVSK